MLSKKPPCSANAVKNWVLFGIPVAFIIGGFTHFAFELSGGNTFVGIFSPVNESVWEHLKMSFWTLLIWWVIGYFLLSRGGCISAAKWFSACAAALYIAPIFITIVYYLYTGALGVRYPIVDILLLLVGIAVAQISAYRIFKCARSHKSRLFWSLLLIAILAAAFVVFTFSPPQIPLFMDMRTGSFGI